MAYSVGIYNHEPFSLFHSSVQYFYDDAVMELGDHYANRTLFVSFTSVTVCSQGYKSVCKLKTRKSVIQGKIAFKSKLNHP